MAEKLGIKPKTVTNRWGELRKKLFPKNESATNGAKGPVPATPRKRKNENGDAGTPKKTPRTAKKKAVSDAIVVDDAGDV